jgi:hypothetical protein
LALPPARCDLAPFDDQRQSEIAEELQPQLLTYRLRNFEGVRNFSASQHGWTFPGTEVARNLVASVLDEAEIVQSIAPLLRRQEQDKITQRSCDVHLAMVEATWAPSHQDREVSISRLTELTNALLHLPR